jgi:hypothetical protein
MSQFTMLNFTESFMREKRGTENGVCDHYLMIISDKSRTIHLAIFDIMLDKLLNHRQ